MKRDIRGVIKRLAMFLEKDLSEKVIDGIIETTSFKSMKSWGKNNIAKVVGVQKAGSKDQKEAKAESEAKDDDVLEGLPVGVPGGFPGGKPPEGIPPEVGKKIFHIECFCRMPLLGNRYLHRNVAVEIPS